MEKVYIVAAQRTAIGKFNGELAPLTAVQLGATVIKDTVCLLYTSPSPRDS